MLSASSLATEKKLVSSDRGLIVLIVASSSKEVSAPLSLEDGENLIFFSGELDWPSAACAVKEDRKFFST